MIAAISSPWRAISSWDTSIRMPTPPAQSHADLGIVLRIVIERSVNRLDALFLQAFETILHLFSRSGEWPFQSLTSPVTRSGSRER